MTTSNKIPDRSIHDALRYFGVNNTLLGYTDTIEGMKLVWENQNRMRNLSRYVYPQIHEVTGRSVQAVKSAMHRAARAAWETDRQRLREYDPSLETTPTNLEFLEVILQYLEDHAEPQRNPHSRRPEGARPSRGFLSKERKAPEQSEKAED